MARDKRFAVLNNIPATALGGMHPDTKRILEELKTTKGKVVAFKAKSAREAKNRLDALRRAKARKHVSYKEGRREGSTLYFRVR